MPPPPLLPPPSSLLIIGAGPVGLSLALALARNGLDVVVFEQDAALNEEIRASTLHPPTLEMLAEWGVIDAVLARGFAVRELAYWERATRQRIATFDYAAIAGDTPYPFRLQCPQHILTRVLLPAVLATGRAQVHFGQRCVGVTDHGTHVTATLVSADNHTHTVDGAWLCAADGARSAVRTALGLGFHGMTYEDRFLLIGTDYDFSAIFPDFGPVNYVYDPAEWVIILRLPDLARVVFRLTEGESAESALAEPALRARMTRFIGQDVPFNIVTTQLYRVHRRVADAFRVGRVLLLGDAAHVNNPAGGMGMNSGIHDAHALAAAFSGRAPRDAALDAWAAARRRVALDSVQAYADQNYRDMATSDPAQRAARNARMAAIAADPVAMRRYLLKASMLEG